MKARPKWSRPAVLEERVRGCEGWRSIGDSVAPAEKVGVPKNL